MLAQIDLRRSAAMEATEPVDARTSLTQTLAAVLGGADITDLQRLSGGASRETWRFLADGVPRIVQRQRAGDERDMMIEADVVRAAGAGGVPVPRLLAAERQPDGASFMVLEAIEGETIARKIQRDDAYVTAREALVADLGTALARIHSLDPASLPGLTQTDQVEYYTSVLDSLGHPHPVLELVRNWLVDHQPPTSSPTVVHGDFRLGNVIVGEQGLNAVIDWELAHVGDPMEDLGWLCVKAWRFGGGPPVAGLGSYDDLVGPYEAARGVAVDRVAMHWWEVLGTWKWAIMCILQASAHLSGASRSHELAAIGRRVCENEYDLFLALEGRW
jgi:aminoglycoside phosphotransferase (APT) family kinase protein